VLLKFVLLVENDGKNEQENDGKVQEFFIETGKL
jgi:hypothetical protein